MQVLHSTMTLGVADSERLSLVRVNFDMMDHSVKVVHEVTSDSFGRQIESEYPGIQGYWFDGQGNFHQT